MLGVDGLDMHPQLEGSHVRHRSKMGQKPKNFKKCDRAKLFKPFDLFSRADNFGLVLCQNRIKMVELCKLKVGEKVASWPIFN